MVNLTVLVRKKIRTRGSRKNILKEGFYFGFLVEIVSLVCLCVFVNVVRVYVWTDDHGRKLKCSAPLYFDYAMSYIQELLTDEDVFPTKAGENRRSFVSTAASSSGHSPFLSC